ncbi:ABC transporter permease [Rhodococcoides fascians]|uniref:ABC transporter permease n=1 Tax=Rhodococcoides fascians TaxID=1828 RepID=UPI00050CBE4A|nr:ABC transporter permease [Rhodococcus fascians]
MRSRTRARTVGRILAVRTGIAIPTVVAVSAAMFALASLSPLDPLAAYLGDRYQSATLSQRQQLRDAYGTDRPWYTAWWTWLTDLLHGDLGWSSTQSLPVSTVLAERLPFTLGLSTLALLLATAIAVVLGSSAGMRRGGMLDRACSVLSTTFAAVPPFVVSLVLVSVFAVTFRWFPTSGARAPGTTYSAAGIAAHAVLPLIALTVSQIPWLLLSMRAAVVDSADSDAVRAARARGIYGWALLRGHVLPSSAAPTLALLGTRLPELIAGAAIVETVFGWPGMAGALVQSAAALDFSLMAATTTAAALAVLLGSALSDAATAAIDPRVRIAA